MAVGNTAVWRVRPSGSNANGGGFDPGVTSPGTDYSQQNAAQVTFNGTSIRFTTAGVSATITLVGYTVLATDNGNVLHITGGTNFTTGWYGIQSVNTGANTWTLDRNCTTGAGAAGTGSMGGGWADWWTNTTSGAAILQPGNIVYILGSGTPNPSSYTYDYTFVGSGTGVTLAAGDVTNGHIIFANDPLTPGYKAPPDTTGGMPVTKTDGRMFQSAMGYVGFDGLYLVASDKLGTDLFDHNGPGFVLFGCVYDDFGKGLVFSEINSDGGGVYACEIFSSVVGTSSFAVTLGAGTFEWVDCNIHDMNVTDVLILANRQTVRNCIISKCTGNAVNVGSGAIYCTVVGNTIDGNGGNGIIVNATNEISTLRAYNNIISNHTGVGKAGFKVSSGTAVQNTAAAAFVDYNSYYNNTANYSAINAGPHDTAVVTTPYVASGTENYTLA